MIDPPQYEWPGSHLKCSSSDLACTWWRMIDPPHTWYHWSQSQVQFLCMISQKSLQTLYAHDTMLISILVLSFFLVNLCVNFQKFSANFSIVSTNFVRLKWFGIPCLQSHFRCCRLQSRFYHVCSLQYQEHIIEKLVTLLNISKCTEIKYIQYLFTDKVLWMLISRHFYFF